MIVLKFKPIERWPTEPTKYRQRSKFDSTYSQTMDLLQKELAHLNAKEVFIHLFLGFGQIRQDGQPYADSKPTQPGVILSFKGKHGDTMMPCDHFDHWRDNLRAIALSLEALRKVDRYGCAKKGEQYVGWKQLPDPLAKAASVLVRHSRLGQSTITRENFDAIWRAATQNTHPDRGGSADDFRAVMEARETIKQAKGWQ
jgi:hypothetical protein